MTGHRDVATEWMNGNVSKGFRVYTDGRTIFSYGPHFPLATRLPSGKILFNSDKYSSTTSKHQTYVLRAIGSKEYIEVDTRTIRHAVDYPNDPIIIMRFKGINPNEIGNALYEYLRDKHVSRHGSKQALKFIEDTIQTAKEKYLARQRGHIVLYDGDYTKTYKFMLDSKKKVCIYYESDKKILGGLYDMFWNMVATQEIKENTIDKELFENMKLKHIATKV